MSRVIQLDDDADWTLQPDADAPVPLEPTASSNAAPEGATKWPRSAILNMYDMATAGMDMADMAKVLKRSTKAVRHAMRKMISQQCLMHDAADVAAEYHMDVHDLRRILSNKKYYVPLAEEKKSLACNPPTWCILTFFVILPIIAAQPLMIFDIRG